MNDQWIRFLFVFARAAVFVTFDASTFVCRVFLGARMRTKL